MTLVRNERIKPLANALNTLGVAHIVTGIVAPIASVVYRVMERNGGNAGGS